MVVSAEPRVTVEALAGMSQPVPPAGFSPPPAREGDAYVPPPSIPGFD